MRGPRWPELGMAAAIGGPELLDVRVTQLERGAEPPIATVTRRRIALSLLGLGALAASFVVAVALVGGPGAVADETGTSVRPLDVLLGLTCVLPLAAAAWVIHRWLSRQARAPRPRSRLSR